MGLVFVEPSNFLSIRGEDVNLYKVEKLGPKVSGTEKTVVALMITHPNRSSIAMRISRMVAYLCTSVLMSTMYGRCKSQR